MKHLDLFSGIGGFSLAAQWVWGDEHEVVCFCEQDKFCQKVLKKHWPSTPIVEDVNDVESILAHTTGKRGGGQGGNALHEGRSSSQSRRTGVQENAIWQDGSAISDDQSADTNATAKKGTKHPGSGRTDVDLLTGGFPCQGFSVAGKQRGKEDERYLWPEMFEVIKAVRPRWVIGENVTGIVNMALDTVLSDLEDQGYATQAFIIPACAQNAPHRRDRVWIVAHSELRGSQVRWSENDAEMGGCNQERKASGYVSSKAEKSSQDVANSNGKGLEEQGIQRTITRSFTNWSVEPNVGRVANGIPSRVDRLKSLGNAIVPQVVVPIMEAIKIINDGKAFE